MYLRFSQRANADGTLVRYVALAHNRRVDGKAKPDVLMNLGRAAPAGTDGVLLLLGDGTRLPVTELPGDGPWTFLVLEPGTADPGPATPATGSPSPEPGGGGTAPDPARAGGRS
jgi:hypothetical protein